MSAMIIGDVIPNDDELIELVRRHEKEARLRTLQGLIDAGHVRASPGHGTVQHDFDQVRVRVGEEVFDDLYRDWPSVELMAKVQLAVQFGETCRPIILGGGMERKPVSLVEADILYGTYADDVLYAGPTKHGVTIKMMDRAIKMMDLEAYRDGNNKKPSGVFTQMKSLLKGVRP